MFIILYYPPHLQKINFCLESSKFIFLKNVNVIITVRSYYETKFVLVTKKKNCFVVVVFYCRFKNVFWKLHLEYGLSKMHESAPIATSYRDQCSIYFLSCHQQSRSTAGGFSTLLCWILSYTFINRGHIIQFKTKYTAFNCIIFTISVGRKKKKCTRFCAYV